MNAFMEYDFDVSRILLAVLVKAGTGAPVHKNRAGHGLAYHIEGDRIYDFGDTRIRARPGDLLYLPKGSDYTVTNITPGDCLAINFLLAGPAVFPPFGIRIKKEGGIPAGFRAAENAWRTRTPGFSLKCKAELYQILYAMRREYEQSYIPKSRSAILTPALEEIHRSYTSGVPDIEALAALCGISQTYFRRIFAGTVGMPPSRYIRELRLTRARELLASGLYSVHEAALASGFADEAYFSREFRKAAGVPPSQYRKERTNE